MVTAVEGCAEDKNVDNADADADAEAERDDDTIVLDTALDPTALELVWGADEGSEVLELIAVCERVVSLECYQVKSKGQY